MAPRFKEVLQFSASSNRFIKKWDSVNQAATAHGISNSQLYKAMQNSKGMGVSLGYIWMYKDAYDRMKELIG